MNKKVVKKVLGSSARFGKKVAIGAVEIVAIHLIADAVETKIDEFKKKAAEKKAEMGFAS